MRSEAGISEWTESSTEILLRSPHERCCFIVCNDFLHGDDDGETGDRLSNLRRRHRAQLREDETPEVYF